ncbi:MAG: hypothetical protein Q4E75_01065 [bacterium]|nr:hypothetical protein [bacterium]
MIYSSKNNNKLKYSTPLIEYIKNNNLYNDENLIFSTKYTAGTYSITNPTKNFTNCTLVNGYPHFHIPLEKILEEIDFFINGGDMYQNFIYIRYGDIHPHKSIPKLGQIRNLLIYDSLNNMIGNKANGIFAIGDISIKTLNNVCKNYDLGISGDDLFIKLVNNTLEPDILKLLKEYDNKAIFQIKTFLESLKLSYDNFILESTLYENHKLYEKIKYNPKYSGELKRNGELKYSLQELIFIASILKNKDDTLINIIGSNQSEHIRKVNNMLNDNDFGVDNRFLSYGMCLNADSNDYGEWSNNLTQFIEEQKFDINIMDYLKVLTFINTNDVAIDYNKLGKYSHQIRKFKDMIDSIKSLDGNKIDINKINNLLCMMGLVNYNLNRAIETGNQNMFYRYLCNISNEYEKNNEEYYSISGLYREFMVTALRRIGYNLNEEKKCKRLVLK